VRFLKAFWTMSAQGWRMKSTIRLKISSGKLAFLIHSSPSGRAANFRTSRLFHGQGSEMP
jgi:hypothetical protein